VCDEFWLVSEGAVKPFDGDLDDYQKWLLETSREMARAAKDAAHGKVKEKKAAAAAPPPPEPVKREDRKASAQARQKIAEQTKPLRKELEALEKKMAALTQEKDNIESAAAQPDLSPAQRVEQGKRLKQIADATEEAEGRWLELTEQIDALSAGA